MVHLNKPKDLLPGSRKAGGQPGNLNALKHGFYSRQLNSMEVLDLSVMSEGLVDEIALMRVLIRRVFEAAGEDLSLEAWSRLLGTLGLASTQLASLLRTQKVLTGRGGGDIAAALSAASKILTAATHESLNPPQGQANLTKSIIPIGPNAGDVYTWTIRMRS